MISVKVPPLTTSIFQISTKRFVRIVDLDLCSVLCDRNKITVLCFSTISQSQTLFLNDT